MKQKCFLKIEKQSKIWDLKMFLVGIFLIVATMLGQSQTVSISGNKFTVGGNQIWFNGINTPWQNWADFGGGFTPQWWRTEFQKYVDSKINLARVWIHCNGLNSPTTSENGSVTGASTLFLTHMDSLVAISKAKKLYILPCLWSFDMVKNTNTSTYQRYRNLINSQANIQSYVDNFLIPLVKRYNNEPYILSWEICNEPEWMFENSENGPIPKANVQRLHAMCAAAIHKNCTKPVTTGASSVKWNSPLYEGTGDNAGNVWSNSALQAVYNDPQAFMDFWQVHWYPSMTQWYYSPFQKTTEYFQIDDKPVLVGETQGMNQCDSYICQTLEQMYENAYLNNFDGVCGWKTPQNDGYGTLENISVATKAFHSNHPELVYPNTTPVAVTGVTVSPNILNVGINATASLLATVLPTDASNRSVTWSSSNTEIATVSSTGVVTGIAAGTATITVTTVEGGFDDVCEVKVALLLTFTITATAGIGGSISPSGNVTVNEGANQTFSIAPGAGYKITDVKVDGTSQGAISSYTFSNVKADHTIDATFEESSCDLLSLFGAPTSSPLASLNSSYKYVYVLGTHAAITNITRFTVNWDLANNGLYEFSINTNNGTPIWYVDLRSSTTYKFNASAPSVTIKSSGTGLDGDYYIANDNGNFVMIDKSAAYAIYFSNSATAPQGCGNTICTITAIAGPGGIISPSGVIPVTPGTGMTFTITANPDYKINDVVVDGVSVGAVSTYTFTGEACGKTIKASFVATTTYTITASAGTGGTITPSGAVSVAQGANQAFTIAASAGYKISDVTVDGASVGKVNNYPFENVTANHTIAASFSPEQGCNLLTLFGVPSTSALPTVANKSFTHAYVLGTGGPELSNVTSFTINWDLPNNGLYQFSFNTNNGVPGWWIDLLPKITKNLNVASPSLKITSSGISGLDDDYWVNYDGTQFIMVAKSGNFAIVGSNSSTPPIGCSSVKSAKEIANVSNANSSEFSIYPNPVDENGSFTINLKNIPYEQLTISIIDFNGRKVISKSMKQTTDNFAFEYKLSKGVYIITLESTNGKNFKTLIVK